MHDTLLATCDHEFERSSKCDVNYTIIITCSPVSVGISVSEAGIINPLVANAATCYAAGKHSVQRWLLWRLSDDFRRNTGLGRMRNPGPAVLSERMLRHVPKLWCAEINFWPDK